MKLPTLDRDFFTLRHTFVLLQDQHSTNKEQGRSFCRLLACARQLGSQKKNQLASSHFRTTPVKKGRVLCLGEAGIEPMPSGPNWTGHLSGLQLTTLSGRFMELGRPGCRPLACARHLSSHALREREQGWRHAVPGFAAPLSENRKASNRVSLALMMAH
jgi:hypothetical protein